MNRRNFLGIVSTIPLVPYIMERGPRTVEHGLVVKDIPIRRIRSKRSADPDGVKFLKRSVDQLGVIRPITVRCVGGRYELIDGVMRTCAAMELGHTTILAKVV